MLAKRIEMITQLALVEKKLVDLMVMLTEMKIV